jgi:hypothetical protein
MKNVELVKIMKEEQKGYPFDQYRCFHIKDFKKGDSIRVREERGERPVRGIVQSIDLDNFLILYKTAESEECQTVIENIVSLEDFRRNWLR